MHSSVDVPTILTLNVLTLCSFIDRTIEVIKFQTVFDKVFSRNIQWTVIENLKKKMHALF